MSIVPVYRLRASLADSAPRYRFSRDAQPSPSPTPGRANPDPDSRWTVDRVSFYAWGDQTHADTTDPRLVPIYEFYRVDAGGRVSYRYAAGPEPPRGWISREHVAFWMHPAATDGAGAPVHIHSQDAPEGSSYALSISPELGVSWTNESVLALAAGTVPVVVSVRPDGNDRGRYHWSYTPTTLNLMYATTIEFVQAPHSAWRFVNLEVPGGREDFDRPIITDDRVLMNARYTHHPRDFRYRLTIEPFAGRGRVTSDADVPGLAASEEHGSFSDRVANDPEVVNQTPDRL